jgi:MaoC like domain
MKTTVLNSVPSIYRLYAKAISNLANSHKTTKAVPSLRVRINNITVDSVHLDDYRSVCGFSGIEKLPITYLHILAFPLHMLMLVSRQFPFPLLGLVHIGNSITQHRTILNSELLNLSCQIGTQRITSKGIEFEIRTSVYVRDDLVWESLSTMLYRQRRLTSKTNNASSKTKDLTHYAQSVTWLASNDIGRKYAKVSKDRNPIHLFAALAKLFGFKKHIAHGMWSKARCLAQLENQLGDKFCHVDVKFKRPLFLPSSVSMSYQQNLNNTVFELSDNVSNSQHVTGEIRVNNNA